MTLAEVRALCRLTLADAAAWPDATLDRWIAAAVRLYSAHFPRRLRSTIVLYTDQQAYVAPGALDCRGVISVEYPAGWVPARLLRPLAEWDAGFGPGCYAVRGVGDDEAATVAMLVFGDAVADGESAVVEYWGSHLVPEVGDDSCALTVPDMHVEAVTAYVAFAAQYELETDEALVTDGSTIVLAELGDGARRAWARYKDVLDRLVWLGGPGVSGPRPTWAGFGL